MDFTPSRVREGELCAVVKNCYAHHHGMAIIAVNNVIFEGRMRERFHSDPVIEAAELLLQEKAPREIPMIYAKTENPMRVDSGGFDDAPMRIVDKPFKAPRTTHMMSNGQYALMVTANGSGYSRWHNWDITRFHADASEDLQEHVPVPARHGKRILVVGNRRTGPQPGRGNQNGLHRRQGGILQDRR